MNAGLQIALMCIAGLNTALLTFGMFTLTDMRTRIERLEDYRMKESEREERRQHRR